MIDEHSPREEVDELRKFLATIDSGIREIEETLRDTCVDAATEASAASAHCQKAEELLEKDEIRNALLEAYEADGWRSAARASKKRTDEILERIRQLLNS